MSTKKKLLLFLLIAPGILAEILSGNTPIIKLFNPVDLFFLVLAYGIPVVLIWDFQNRYKISYLGLFCIGLAYGIFNEWLIAKTILATSTVPMGGFRDFGIGWWLNTSWMLMILFWHAFHSVVFPITFAWLLFPEKKSEILFGKKATIFWVVLCFVILVILAKEWQWSISSILYFLFYGAAVMLLVLSKKIYDPPEVVSQEKKWSYLIWFLTIFLYLFLFIGASHMPFLLYGVIGFMGFVFFIRYFIRLTLDEKCRFGVGWYLSFWGFATTATLFAWRIDLLIMYTLLLGSLHYFVLRKK